LPQFKFQDSLSNSTSLSEFGLGLMSGTSLDGLDLALCEFREVDQNYTFKLHKTKTLTYSSDWKQKLKEAPNLSAEAYFSLNASFAKLMAHEVLDFLGEVHEKPTFLSSHGHTVFHQPKNGFSTQLGCGATLAATTGISTICDFRSMDVALGGQGAPLVPIGDKLLFGNYQACVNLGGIANISFDNLSGKRMAFDICVANLLLNNLSEKLGKDYDENGRLAQKGKMDFKLLKQLNELDYYQIRGSKSLGREWFSAVILPLLENNSAPIEDQLATSVEHIAITIAKSLSEHQLKEALFTGGGAFNTFLMERIQHHCATKCTVADAQIVNFKEALIFAFLGYLRLKGKTNALQSVTAASRDSISGALYFGGS